ncbi:nuclear transport factor 2 family protein [Mycobacterium sp. 852002-51057_SCH5723018]|uniref:nuclear transport factor 2 family protein n=1 Tax=Mycobacterium sp. 852002-51057_SCH5723018 TaxID=1834094 RepID=UPI000A944A5C|nr:nuclear transport factor 2 family protein [Mycobacterium sp. 852002-51057_SCH5723018]
MTQAHRLDAAPTQPDQDVDEFVEKFSEFGAQPTPAALSQLFHTAGTLWDAGMHSPLPQSRLRAAAERFVRNVSSVQIAVRKHFAREDCVYLLTDNFGAYQGSQISYPAVYACRLRDGLIVEGRCFYDQARLLAPAVGGTLALPAYRPTWEPALAGAPAAGAGAAVEPAKFVRNYDALWHADNAEVGMGLASCYNSNGMILNPGMARPIMKPEIPGYYAMLLAAVPDLDPKLEGWAGDGDALCVEWLYRGAGGDGRSPLAVRVVDVFEFAGGGVQFGHAYYDSLTILSASRADLAKVVAKARASFFC